MHEAAAAQQPSTDTWASGCHSSTSPFGPRTHQTNSSPQPRCQLNRDFVDELRGKRLLSTPHTPGARFTAALLGVSSDVNKFVTRRKPRPRPPLCKRLGEQPAFESLCAARMEEMNAALAAAKGRRGLIIRFVGRGRWGIGHTLSHVFCLFCTTSATGFDATATSSSSTQSCSASSRMPMARAGLHQLLLLPNTPATSSRSRSRERPARLLYMSGF